MPRRRPAENGAEKVTLEQVATASGVSLASASLALNDRPGVSDVTRARVVETAKRLGYALPLKRRDPVHNPTITVVLEQLPVAPTSDPFNKPILLGIERAARNHQFRIVMEFATPEDRPNDAHWRQSGTEGVLLLGGGDLRREWIQTAIDSRLPVVIVDHVIPGLDLPSVVPDNLAGAYEATRHLIDAGHERIGFIRGPSKYWTLSERLAGYMLALAHSGRWPVQSLVPPRVSHGDEKGYGEMLALLDLPEPPTAVLAVSDKAAVGAYRAVTERGLSVPGDISIVGFDDIELGRALNPPLTTVRVPGEEMGRVAFERLHRQIAAAGRDPALPLQTRISIPTHLVERGSVARRR
jgi:LacI family transcriptional regulator